MTPMKIDGGWQCPSCGHKFRGKGDCQDHINTVCKGQPDRSY